MRSVQEKEQQRQLNVVFCIFDGGMGFRYVLPEQKQLRGSVIMDEATESYFKGDPETWTLPYGAGYCEGPWTKDNLSKKGKVYALVTIEVKPDLHTTLYEANLTDYSSLSVKPIETKEGNVRLKAELVLWLSNDLVRARTPFVNPRRVLSMEGEVGGLIISHVILNPNDLCKIRDTSWAITGRYVGIW